MRILVLGGTGLVGQGVLAYLFRHAPGIRATVVSRSHAAVPGAFEVINAHYGVLAGRGDFRDRLGSFTAALHLADGLSVLQKGNGGSAGDRFADQQIEASVRLATAVRDAQFPVFIYLSSIKAICDEEDTRLLDEAAAARSSTLYGTSKLRLERQLASLFGGMPNRLIIVRTPVLYGEDGRGESLLRLLRLADTGIPLPLANVHNRRSVLCVRNLASALCAIITASRQCPGGTYHIHDGPAPSTTEIVETLRDALGRPRRLFSLGHLMASLAKTIGPFAATGRRLFGSLELSDARFRNVFAWHPPIETRPALRKMAVAYLAAKRQARGGCCG